MKKLLAVIIPALLVCLSGCSDKNEMVSSSSTALPVTSGTESTVSEENSSLSVNGSTENMPLDMNTWGTAAKYDPATDTYINVPVRITNIITGTEAQTIVHRFTAQSSSYTDTQLSEDCEWTVAEYEISPENYPVPKGGITPDIVSSVTTGDGKPFLLNGKRWNTVTINISKEEYFFEGLLKGQIAYMMIKNHSDYVIVLGENGEQQAFFKVK